MTSHIRSARFRGLGLMSRETNEQTPRRGSEPTDPGGVGPLFDTGTADRTRCGRDRHGGSSLCTNVHSGRKEAGQSASHFYFWSDEEPSHLNSTSMPADEETVLPVVVTGRGRRWWPNERIHEGVFAS